MTLVSATLVLIGAVALVRRASGRRGRRRQAAVDAGLGFTVDLVAVVLGSGGTIRQAIALVATEGPDSIRPAFAAILERSVAGHLLVDALAEASIELGPVFHPLLGILAGAEVDGAPVAAVLARLGDDAEQRHRWQEDAMAGRLPVALVPPLVVCLLPAVVIGAIVPLAVVAMGQLRG